VRGASVHRTLDRRSQVRTDAQGRYAFAPSLRRNHQVRVRLEGVAPERDSLSPLAHAYVLPAFTLSSRSAAAAGSACSRSTRSRARPAHGADPLLRRTVQAGRRGRCTAERAPFRVQTETRRVRAGRYVARATVRIPASYEGRFSYVSCFAYSEGRGWATRTCAARGVSVRLATERSARPARRTSRRATSGRTRCAGARQRRTARDPGGVQR
jgi:hypothetical protein